MKRKILKSIVLCVVTITIVCCGNLNIFADEESACALSEYPIPKEGETILLADDSYYIESVGTSIGVSVNKTYSVRIQDTSGSCVSSAKVQVKGYYSYDKTTNNVLSSSLNASFISVPTFWDAQVVSQWDNISGSSLSYGIYYKSKVDDSYSCMVGGGYWFSGETFTIR